VAFTLTREIHDRAIEAVLQGYILPVEAKLQAAGYANPVRFLGKLATTDYRGWTENQVACALAAGVKRNWGYRIVSQLGFQPTMHTPSPCINHPIMVHGSFAVVCVLLLSDSESLIDVRGALTMSSVMVRHQAGGCLITIALEDDKLEISTSAGVQMSERVSWMTSVDVVKQAHELGASENVMKALRHETAQNPLSLSWRTVSLYQQVLTNALASQ
jgi:hypothetical protein